jgi:hypothetical protein
VANLKQNAPIRQNGGSDETAVVLARQHGVSSRTIERDGQFAEAAVVEAAFVRSAGDSSLSFSGAELPLPAAANGLTHRDCSHAVPTSLVARFWRFKKA